jgi:uncharacterized protein (TIGR01777 family)
VISGATGLIGRALAAALAAARHDVVRLTRRPAPPRPDAIGWDPRAGRIDAAGLAGADAVVHLAGESVAGGRWTQARKRAIRESRTAGTHLLATALAGLSRPPRVLISASAIGYYGDRGDELLTEDSPPGSGFLAEVAQAWEAAADPARRAAIRVVHPRIGMVLAAHGGALATMVPIFRLGLGGVVGSGGQHVSWIGLGDLVEAIRFLLAADGIAGPVNAVAPHPVTNRELTRTLGRILRRPTLVPLPAFLVPVVFGEMGPALLLASARVRPARLQAAGFRFAHSTLERALRAELGRPA